VENKLHTLICGGTITLGTAQRAIASNWWIAYLTYVGAARLPRPTRLQLSRRLHPLQSHLTVARPRSATTAPTPTPPITRVHAHATAASRCSTSRGPTLDRVELAKPLRHSQEQLRCVIRSVHVCLRRRLGTRWQADIALGMLSSLLPLLQDGLRLRLRIVASYSHFLGQQFRTPGHVSRRCVIVMVIGRWYLVSRHVPSLREELLGRIP
jgi:hypothetical protein